MMKIICINGAPGSGKDTCGELLSEIYDNVRIVKFAHPLDDIAKRLLNMRDGDFDYYRNQGKEESLLKWGCKLTMRQLLIKISESLIKPSFGREWFAEQCAMYVVRTYQEGETIVVTDSGFQYEFNWFKNRLKDFAQIRLIHLTRKGCTFDGDSRQVVSDGENTVYINNDGTKEELKSLLSVELF